MSDRRLEWLGWTAVAVTAVVIVVFGTQISTDGPGVVASPLIGREVATLTLPALEGGPDVEIGPESGDITVVTFFASWCAPCREEQPQLTAAANQLAGEGVRFVEIVYQDDPAAASEFLDRFGRSEYAEFALDPESRAAIEFGIFGIPETFFIDRSGVIVGKVSGGVDVALLLSTIDIIDRGEIPGEASTGETFQTP